MFSGLVEDLGSVEAAVRDERGGMRLTISSTTLFEDVELKDSIAVDGVCLTVAARDRRTAVFDVVPETLWRSTIVSRKAGDRINLERSLRVGDRIGGHLVYGHVDLVATVLSRMPEGQGFRLSVETPPELARYLIEKGCVALDGVSLTIAAVRNGFFEIALIPETAARTTLGKKGAGDRVNLEIDPIARYALGSVEHYTSAPGPTDEELAWAYEI